MGMYVGEDGRMGGWGKAGVCPGIHKGEGQKSERLFFCFSLFQGGGAQLRKLQMK